MTREVQDELEALLAYARGVGSAAAQLPERADIVSGGRGYIGGALTTLLHVGLLTEDEYKTWWDLLNDELPPTNGAIFG